MVLYMLITINFMQNNLLYNLAEGDQSVNNYGGGEGKCVHIIIGERAKRARHYQG